MVTRRQGFTLIEVMVAVVLFMLVMLLLSRGVTAVTSTVSMGQRQSRLHHQLRAVERVMRQDLESLVVHGNWPVFVGDFSAAVPQTGLGLAFLKYRSGVSGETETEWVQYWMEPHPEIDRLSQWVRYARPATDRDSFTGDWWNQITPKLTPDQLSKEILADEMIQIECKVWTSEAQAAASTFITHRIEAVDVQIFVSAEPVAVLQTPVLSPLNRMWQEEGGWTLM